ncbi:hypothetical protein JCM8202_002882 [Rhodotorula sphaerocarpa]
MSTVESINLDEVYAYAIQLAREAGQRILAGSAKRHQAAASLDGPNTKKNSVDLVTETDQAVEAYIKDSISQTYPNFRFIGEESYAGGERVELTDEPTFIVDPIDGTTNFVHGLDFVCCSIGFTYKQEPVIGVIYNPFLEKLYSAQKGKGAWLNQTTRLPLSHPNAAPLASLGDAVIGVEWGSDRSKEVIEKKGRMYMRLAGDPKEVEGGVMAHSLRSIGSAALHYAYVAAGQLDLYFEIGCWSWDVCAGIIIAREAGGKVYGRNGKSWEAQDLMRHHYTVVRAIADAPDGSETGEQAQDRIAKEFFQAAEDWEA